MAKEFNLPEDEANPRSTDCSSLRELIDAVNRLANAVERIAGQRDPVGEAFRECVAESERVKALLPAGFRDISKDLRVTDRVAALVRVVGEQEAIEMYQSQASRLRQVRCPADVRFLEKVGAKKHRELLDSLGK